MPAVEYDAWERHFLSGLAPEVWVPMLLVHIIDMLPGLAGGAPGRLHRSLPWLAPDDGLTPAERDVAVERKFMSSLRASRMHRAQEALAALRLRKD